MKLASTAVMAGLMLCLSSGCDSVAGNAATDRDQTLIDDTFSEVSGSENTGPIDPAALNPVRPVGASARPPRPIEDGDSSVEADSAFGLENLGGEDPALGASEAPTVAEGLGSGDNILTTSIVNAWTFPFFEAALMANELSLLVDAMTIDLLYPVAPVDSPPTYADSFTRLERLCIASGELEFICRQRYGSPRRAHRRLVLSPVGAW